MKNQEDRVVGRKDDEERWEGPGGPVRTAGDSAGGEKQPAPARKPGRPSAAEPEEFDEDPVPEDDEDE